jgi:dTDP-4-dehydrorhamnose 3,5-epimerase-like enzyme
MLYTDERGEVHSIKDVDVGFDIREVLVSRSRKGTFRGFHQSPYAKYVYCLDGNVSDFYKDATGKEVTVSLLRGNHVLVPANSPHGFFANEDSTLVYLLAGKFNKLMDKNIYWNSPELGFKVPKPVFISENDKDSLYESQYDILLLGGSGFLGSYTYQKLKDTWRVLSVSTRLENLSELETCIRKSSCSYVICAAGVSGRPTTQWCEEHPRETFETNVTSMLGLMKLCDHLGVHLTIYGSGMVYDQNKPEYCCYTEEDPPSLLHRIYSKYRVLLEDASRLYSNVLYLRIIYPCSFDGNPRCFYEKMKGRIPDAVRVPLTILPSMLPVLSAMLQKKLVGVYNFANKGSMPLTDGYPTMRGFELSVDKLERDLDWIKIECVKDAMVKEIT